MSTVIVILIVIIVLMTFSFLAPFYLGLALGIPAIWLGFLAPGLIFIVCGIVANIWFFGVVNTIRASDPPASSGSYVGAAYGDPFDTEEYDDLYAEATIDGMYAPVSVDDPYASECPSCGGGGDDFDGYHCFYCDEDV